MGCTLFREGKVQYVFGNTLNILILLNTLTYYTLIITPTTLRCTETVDSFGIYSEAKSFFLKQETVVCCRAVRLAIQSTPTAPHTILEFTLLVRSVAVVFVLSQLRRDHEIHPTARTEGLLKKYMSDINTSSHKVPRINFHLSRDNSCGLTW